MYFEILQSLKAFICRFGSVNANLNDASDISELGLDSVEKVDFWTLFIY